MALKHTPFEPKALEEDRIKADIISVKLNHEERQWLEALKRCYHTENDSTALKKEAFKVFKQMQELDEVRRRK